MAFIKISGHNINYEIVGCTGPFVALITGGRRGYQELLPLAHKIAVRGFQILLHDRRNTGASDLVFSSEKTEEEFWAEDLYELLDVLDASPAFIGGSSSGARTAILYGLQFSKSVRGLLLLRVTGGSFAAKRLPELYYDQYIRAAEQGGMHAVCNTEAYQDRIAANPRHKETILNLSKEFFIEVMKNQKNHFLKKAHHPVMGVTPDELESIELPTLVIPGNDQTHSSESGLAAHRSIPGSSLHQLPIADQPVPIIHFNEWSQYEDEIAKVFAEFMNSVSLEQKINR